jgi:NAD(P)H-dependent FMN reductase
VPVTILLISGSTREGSTNSAALRTAHALPVEGVVTAHGVEIDTLPAFNPDDDHDSPPEPVVRLRAGIADADAVLFCAPEYAGTLPGSFKNLLDWTVGGGELYGKPVAWLNVAAEGRGCGAEATLRTVLGYVGAVIVEPACVRIPVSRYTVGHDNRVNDPAVLSAIADTLRAIARAVSARGGTMPACAEASKPSAHRSSTTTT